MRHSRSFYISKDATELKDEKSDAVVYIEIKNGKLYMMGFCGKRQKPDFNYRYLSDKHLSQTAVDYFLSRRRTLAAKESARVERAAKRAKGHGIQIGHIFRCSWGYDQTNVDYYQVVGLKGKTMVTLREIGCTSGDATGPFSDKVMPAADTFCSEPFNKRVAEDGYIKISNCQYARLWNGTADHRSWGH